MIDDLFLAFQHLIPQHILSRTAGRLANIRVQWIKNFFIDQFIRTYNVDLSQAEFTDPHSYSTFNQFFTRKLRADVRPIPPEPQAIISPVDGTIYQVGKINDGRIIQAKGIDFSVQELLGGNERLASEFSTGDFTTIYLAPKDYHRIHMPITGKLQEMIYIPGRLFSVNPTTTNNIPRLFARNERVACIFETSIGNVAIVLVGAVIVGSIHTVFAGQITPSKSNTVQTWAYDANHLTLARAAELGHFQLGSTVIVLFPKDKIIWEESAIINKEVKMGEKLAIISHYSNEVCT
jgi:phosphatidylserine decarboxylase